MKKFIVLPVFLTLALSCGGGGGGGGGESTPAAPEYPYVCTNGTAVSGTSAVENEQRCSACNTNWELTDGICEGNSYTCPKGVPSDGMPPTDGDVSCASCNTSSGGYKRTTDDPPDCKRLGAVYIWLNIDPTDSRPQDYKDDGRWFRGDSSAPAGKERADSFCADEFGDSVNQGSGLSVPNGYPLSHRALLAVSGSGGNPVNWTLVGNSMYFTGLKVRKPASPNVKVADTWRDLFLYQASGDGFTITPGDILVDSSVVPASTEYFAWTGLKWPDSPSGNYLVRGDTCNDWTEGSTGNGEVGEPYNNADSLADNIIKYIFAGADAACSSSYLIICVTY